MQVELIPLLLCVFLAGVVLRAVYSRLRWRRRGIASKTWPLISANYEDGSIEVIRSEHSPRGGSAYALEVQFSYVACGSRYSGSYCERFRNRAEAQGVLGSLERGPLLVRYNPSDPSEYYIDPYRDVRDLNGG
jgi:hypothetical protein